MAGVSFLCRVDVMASTTNRFPCMTHVCRCVICHPSACPFFLTLTPITPSPYVYGTCCGNDNKLKVYVESRHGAVRPDKGTAGRIHFLHSEHVKMDEEEETSLCVFMLGCNGPCKQQ